MDRKPKESVLPTRSNPASCRIYFTGLGRGFAAVSDREEDFAGGRLEWGKLGPVGSDY
jgi:hypothetical protein